VADTDRSAVPSTIQELWQLLVAYARQETIGPLKGIGRYLGYGVGGALLVAIGVILLALAGLRALQTETGSTFTGNLSWIPYLIVLAGLAVVIGVALGAINRKGRA
jgi:hypothetical protein